jgi:hypothetical protein
MQRIFISRDINLIICLVKHAKIINNNNVNLHQVLNPCTKPLTFTTNHVERNIANNVSAGTMNKGKKQAAAPLREN